MKNKRRIFRIEMDKTPCDIYDKNGGKEGVIRNINDEGMAIKINLQSYDIVPDDFQISFDILEEPFKLNCKTIRIDKNTSYYTLIAAKILQTEQQREALYNKLLQVQAIRRSYNNRN